MGLVVMFSTTMDFTGTGTLSPGRVNLKIQISKKNVFLAVIEIFLHFCRCNLTKKDLLSN
jgi:hypothetical protein